MSDRCVGYAYWLRSIVSAGCAVGAFLVFVVLSPETSHGAYSRIHAELPPSGPLVQGARFRMPIFVDSDQPLNAYLIDLVYPPALLELVEIDDSDSLIDVSPGAPRLTAGGGVRFEGASLKPFLGMRGELLTLVFEARSAGEGSISFRTPTSVYLANGKGTKVTPGTDDLVFTILPAENGNVLPPKNDISDGLHKDIRPPIIERISFVDNPIEPKRKFAGFYVSDGESGVRETEARFRTGFFWSPWRSVRNPTEVPSNAWAFSLLVRDNAGNTVVENVYDWHMFGYAIVIRLAALIGIVAVFIAFL